MNQVSDSITAIVRQKYLAYLGQFTHEEKFNISVNHFGVFSRDFINGILAHIEDLLLSFGDDKTQIRRVFAIVLEGLQNIKNHGEKDSNGIQTAFVFLCKNKTTYKIVFGNIVLVEDCAQLDEYLQNINQLGIVELKEMHHKLLSKDYTSKKSSTGLGFLTMRIKSENPLVYNLDKLNTEKSVFTVEVTINRKK